MKKNFLLMGAFAALMLSCSSQREETLPENPRDGQEYRDGSSRWVWNSAMNYWMIRSITNSMSPVHYYYPSTRQWSEGVKNASGGYHPSTFKTTTPPSTVPPATVQTSYKANSASSKSGTNSSSGMKKGGFGKSGSSSAS